MSTLRRLARNVAKANMKKAGMVQVCKRLHTAPNDQGILVPIKGKSWFSANWREWVKK